MIPDVDGHAASFVMGEGATVLETGEMAWHKSVVFSDMIKYPFSLSSILHTFLMAQ